MPKNAQLYLDNGIKIEKLPLTVGKEINIYYNGILAEHGADGIYIHLGYGDQWYEKQYIQMDPAENGFVVKFCPAQSGKLCFAFKDSASNWDNNSGENYCLEIKEKTVRKSSTPKSDKVKTVSKKRELKPRQSLQ